MRKVLKEYWGGRLPNALPQDNVSEIDKKNLKMTAKFDRKREWRATAANWRFGASEGIAPRKVQ